MLFSIIIPILNRASTLPRLFASLDSIRTKEVEVILVDNGSTDDSIKICKIFRKRKEKSQLQIILTQEEKPSASAARNKGVLLSSGQYLYFFDSDDVFSSDFLEDALPLLNSVELICAHTLMVFPDGSSKVRVTSLQNLLIGHLLTGALSTQSVIVSRTLWERCGKWNESLRQWDDWEFGLRLLLAQPIIGWLPKSHYHRIYQHSNSLTGTPLKKSMPFYEQALAIAEDALKKSHLSSRIQEIAYLAIQGKRLLLAKEGYKQQAFKEKEILKSTAFGKLSKKTKTFFSLFYYLHIKGLRGVWRFYYCYCRLLLSLEICNFASVYGRIAKELY